MHARWLVSLLPALFACSCLDSITSGSSPTPHFNPHTDAGRDVTSATDAAADRPLRDDVAVSPDRPPPPPVDASATPDRPAPTIDAGSDAPVGSPDDRPALDAPGRDAPVLPDVPTAVDTPSPPDAPPPDAPRDTPPPPPDVAPPDAGVGPATCDRIPTREPVTLYLSADDSNSMASPVIARREIRRGHIVSARAVRTWEFLNYYNVPYAPAEAGSLAVAGAARAGLAPGAIELQVGVSSERRPLARVRPMTLTLVLDDSGSMIVDDRIDRARAAVRAIAGSLRPGDIVSAVTWNTRAATVLAGHRVTGPGDPRLLAVATDLLPRDSTDLSSGLRAGYALARAHAAPERLNRVVLVTDGEANVGATDAETIAAAARDGDRDGIYLVGVGVGDGFNDTLLDAVTDLGRGAYVFLDSDAEAAEVFDERFTEVMDVAARAVRLELTLPWYMRVVEFSGEAISGDPRAVRPQHLAPDDAMVFRQVLTPCAADRVRGADPVRLRATWESPSGAPMSVTRDSTLDALLAADDGALRRGRAIVAWAEALQHAEPLARRATRADLSALRASLAQVRALVAAAPGAAVDPGLREIDSLAAAYERLFAP